MRSAKSFCFLSIVLLIIAAFAAKSEAQSAGVTGLVTDSSGSVIPGTAIAVTDEATGVARKTQSDAAGNYNVAALPVGIYTVRAEKTGFAPVERTGVTLSVDITTTVNFQLSVQNVSQVVTVHGNASMLETSSPKLSTVISQEEYNNLPLIQTDRYRSPVLFMFLAPGTQGNYSVNGQTTSSVVPNFYVHGSPAQWTETLVDGLVAGQALQIGDLSESAPPVDAVQEFNFTTSFLPAQYGHTGTAVVNFTLKSGTNQLHGTAYNYYEMRNWNAAPWGSVEPPNTHEDEFGGAIGLPVVIPHVYNGRNRTFVFFLYGGSRKSGLDTLQSLTIATPAMVSGNFSGVPRTIYDPATTTLQPNGTYTRTAFPGNIIPASRIDPVAKAIAAYLPSPNQAGNANYKTFSGELFVNPSIYVGRVDHQIAVNHHLSVDFIHTDIPRQNIPTSLPYPLWTNADQTTRSVTLRANYDWTIGANKLNNLALGYNRFVNLIPPPPPPRNWPEVLGLPNVPGPTFPYIDFVTNGYTFLANFRNDADYEDTYQARDTFMWTVGRHTLSFGAEFRRPNLNDDNSIPAKSQWNYSALETGLPTAQGSTGDSFGSFLLGATDAATLTLPYSFYTRFEYYGVFAQDDFKVTPKLTLNLGFRWEFETPPIEKYDHQSAISLTTPNPGAGNRPGALVFAGPPPVGIGRRAFFSTDYSGFSPRIGLSYLIKPQTVVRAGYGMFYADPLGSFYSLLTNGFQAAATVTSPNNGITPALYLQNGFPPGQSLAPTLSPTLINGQPASYYPSNADAMPRIQQWQIGVEQGLGKNWSLSVDYIGNHATRVTNPQMVNINQVSAQYLSLGSTLTAPATSAPAIAAGIKLPYPGFNGTVAQALRAYPQYLTLTSQLAKEGASIYNGLQVVVTRRFTSGFTFNGNYTYAKSLGYGAFTNEYANSGGGVTNGVQDAGNLHADWSLLPADVRHTFIFYYIYQLPFGRGSRWLNHGGLMDELVGGWRLNAIQRYQSGFPLQLITANTLPIFNYALRPNRVPGVPMNNHIPVGKFNPTSSTIINKAAFSQPAAYTFGNASPAYDGLTEFSILDEDVSVVKAFQIGDRLTWTWYGQASNVFNRHAFLAPDTNFNDAGFGQTTVTSAPRHLQVGTRFTF